MTEDPREDAREFLAARLIELHEAAGSPPLESVASRAMARRQQNASWRVTAKRVSDWKRGRNVPESADALAAVTRHLIEIALPRAKHDQVTKGLYDIGAWLRWWAAARQKRPGSSSAPDDATSASRPIAQLDPIDLEVHAAIDAGAASAGLGALPAYIRREHDDWLAAIVAEAASGRSKLAVLVGDSSTGKTRACWEAIQALPSSWRLWHPIQPGRPEAASEVLDQVGPKTVVWLNEINYYLLTPGRGLGERVAAVLRELLRLDRCEPVLVLGTIWPEYWAALTTPSDPNAPDDPHAQARELLTGKSAMVPESFNDAAVMAAFNLASDDPRLTEAIRSSEGGRVTQYLAGVPVLIERWRNAPFAARAVIETAMDARRLGHGASLPRALLEAGAPCYMTDQQWDSLEDDWFDQAMAYTAATCRGIRGLLTRVRPSLRRPDPGQPLYRLTDYLEQLSTVERSTITPSAQVWEVYASHAAPEDLSRLATAAQERKQTAAALRLWTAAADAGDQSASWRAALTLRQLGEVDQALPWYVRAFDAGYDIALEQAAEMLQDAGRMQEALLWYQRAADDGDTFALHQVVVLLQDAGRTDEARAWLRERAESGVPALRHLALMVRKSGNIGEAISIYEQAAQAGDLDSLAEIARMLQEAGQIDEAINWYQRSATAGDNFASRQAARMLQKAGRIDDSLAWFDSAGQTGDISAFSEAAQMLGKVGRIEEALLRYEQAAGAGDTFASWRAARMLRTAGRVDEAIHWYRDAVLDGDKAALDDAVVMLEQVNRGNEISPWLQALAEAGNEPALDRSVPILLQEGGSDAALSWLQRLAYRGNQRAVHHFMSIIKDLDRDDEKADWLKRITDTRDVEIMISVGRLFHQSGDEEEAIAWLKRAAEAGSTRVLEYVVSTMTQAGRLDEATAWLSERMVCDDEIALYAVIETLIRENRVDDARKWLVMQSEVNAGDLYDSATRRLEMSANDLDVTATEQSRMMLNRNHTIETLGYVSRLDWPTQASGATVLRGNKVRNHTDGLF